jgi:hypothetical protein
MFVKKLLITLALTISPVLVSSLHAAIISDGTVILSSSASTPGAGDGVAQLLTGAPVSNMNYSNVVNGESFTLGSAASYQLNSISILTGGASDYPAATWTLELATFDNTASGGYGGRTDGLTSYSNQYLNNTSLSVDNTGPNNTAHNSNNTEMFTSIATTNFTVGDWLTFTFASPITVTGNNSTYMFSLQTSTGYVGFSATGTDLTGSGMKQFTSYNNAPTPDNYVQTPYTGAETFVVNALAVPEPQTSAMLLSLGVLACFQRSRRHSA